MTAKPAARPSRGTAVVIGGSMAGLSAAAVLSPRFESVVIVERDALPDGPADRRGVPQGRHAHGLLPAGLSRLEGWFPGLTEELVADGASSVDIGADAVWFQGGGYRHRFPTDISGPLASRALLEHHVRRRTLALANVTLHAPAAAERSSPGLRNPQGHRPQRPADRGRRPEPRWSTRLPRPPGRAHRVVGARPPGARVEGAGRVRRHRLVTGRVSGGRRTGYRS